MISDKKTSHKINTSHSNIFSAFSISKGDDDERILCICLNHAFAVVGSTNYTKKMLCSRFYLVHKSTIINTDDLFTYDDDNDLTTAISTQLTSMINFNFFFFSKTLSMLDVDSNMPRPDRFRI